MLMPRASEAQVTRAKADTVPLHSVPQHMPCRRQPVTYKAAVAEWETAAVPSPAASSGVWAAIGFIGEEGSFNCTGVVRGPAFEFVFDFTRDSVKVDMIGMPLTSYQVTWRDALLVPLEDGGDYVRTYRCRQTARLTLLCIEPRLQWVLEFARITVAPSQRASTYRRDRSP